MRLWHEALIPLLPREQLLGQHRECCALRGLGWGKKHAVVNYVFDHPMGWLVAYHWKVMDEMESRGYAPALDWIQPGYRGAKADGLAGADLLAAHEDAKKKYICSTLDGCKIYPEHDDRYLQECLQNLAGKGIFIDLK